MAKIPNVFVTIVWIIVGASANQDDDVSLLQLHSEMVGGGDDEHSHGINEIDELLEENMENDAGPETDDLSTEALLRLDDEHLQQDGEKDFQGADGAGATAISLDGVMAGSPPDCVAAKRMDIGGSTVSYSNLGNMGPDTASPEGILFSNVLADSGTHVNLHVSAISRYTPKDQAGNGKVNSFGRINVATGTDVSLRFQFQNANGEPQVMDPYTITFIDLDEQKTEGYGRESLRVADEHEYILTKNTNVGIKLLNKDGTRVFHSTAYGAGNDNPKNAMSLTQSQKDKAVQLVFPAGSTFHATFSAGDIPPHWATSSRNMLFAGQTNVFCPADPPPAEHAPCTSMTCPAGTKPKSKKKIEGMHCNGEECTEEDDTWTCCQADHCSAARQLTVENNLVRNNLGNLGPDSGEEGMLFKDVFPASGKNIDMLVSASDSYQRDPEKANGIKGKVGKINLVTGGEVDLTFTFINAITQKPIKVGSFYMSFLDFDEQQTEGKAREYVTVTGHKKFDSSKKSVVGYVNVDPETVMFHSTTFGTGDDNVGNPRQMSQEQLDKSISVLFPSSKSISVNFKIERLQKGGNDRFIQFSGVTNLVC